MDDHQFKKEEQETVEELSKVWFEIDLKCLYLESIARSDIPWSVKKLAREVTKWTRACDRRSARSISYIHNTRNFRNYCHVGNNARRVQIWDSFKMPTLLGILEIQKQPRMAFCASWEVERTFVPISWMCKKQSAVSHCSKDSEAISSDAGLRMEGILALDLRDLVHGVLHAPPPTLLSPRKPSAKRSQCEAYPTRRTITKSPTSEESCSREIDYVTPNAKRCRHNALLYTFDDNEAVIKMIISKARVRR